VRHTGRNVIIVLSIIIIALIVLVALFATGVIPRLTKAPAVQITGITRQLFYSGGFRFFGPSVQTTCDQCPIYGPAGSSLSITVMHLNNSGGKVHCANITIAAPFAFSTNGPTSGGSGPYCVASGQTFPVTLPIKLPEAAGAYNLVISVYAT
jgi:hypothetical protein